MTFFRARTNLRKELEKDENDLTCEVVQDLLPSYVDGLTSDVSNQAVEQHLKICEVAKNYIVK